MGSLVEPKLPVMGFLKKGDKKPSEGGYGPELDYWRFVPKERYKFMGRVFQEVYGDEPRSLAVYVTEAEPEKALHQHFAEFAGAGKDPNGGYLKRMCDGKEIYKHLPADSHLYSLEPKPCEAPRCKCEPVGRMQLLLCDLFVMGFTEPVEVYLKSPNDRANVLGALVNAKMQLDGLGQSLKFARFYLERVEERISVPVFKPGSKIPEPGKRKKASKWMVNLRFDPEWWQQVRREAYDRQLQGNRGQIILPAAKELALPGSVQPALPAAQTPQDVLDKIERNRDLIAAPVSEIVGELVEEEDESEFLPAGTNRNNFTELKAFSNRLGLKDEDIKTVMAMRFNGVNSSQLRPHHMSSLKDWLLIYWASKQERPGGIPLFESIQAAEQKFWGTNLDTDAISRCDQWTVVVGEMLGGV